MGNAVLARRQEPRCPCRRRTERTHGQAPPLLAAPLAHGTLAFITLAAIVLLSQRTSAAEPPPTVHVEMITGHHVGGRLIEFDDQVLVLEVGGFPCAIGFEQVEFESAYHTLYRLYVHRRGGRDKLTAEDHLRLGRFALERNLEGRARRRFAAAHKLDPSLSKDVEEAWAAHRRAREGALETVFPKEEQPPIEDDALGFTGQNRLSHSDADPARAKINAAIVEGYKAVGAQVRDEVGADMVLVETPHFLIWTDWAKAEHPLLRGWCEGMHRAVSSRFGLAPEVNVFAGKCPVFCLRSQRRFQKVARLLDNYDAADALGYTSSSSNGHVHVVVRRQGGSPAGRDAFASTLIHEATHAFLHRYRTGRHVPAWLNEGLANFIAEAVLDERCSNGEAADAVAKAVAAGDYPIADLFSDEAMEARHYPVAHSLVAFLIDLDAPAFVRLVDDVKLGRTAEEALHRHYRLTFEALERRWREAHRPADPE